MLNIFFFQAYSQQKPFCNENYRNSSNSSSTTCDSVNLFNYYPYDSTETKDYYLHLIVQTDSAGNSIGGITEADINFLMLNTNTILNPHKFDFCYTVNFSDNPDDFIHTDSPLPFKEQIMYVIVRDCSSLGLSGNPICLDFVAVMDSTVFGGNVLAHELAHNFGLDHTPLDPNNLMYPSSGGGYYLADTQVARMHYIAELWFPQNYYIFYNTLRAFGSKICKKQWAPYGRFYVDKNMGCPPLTVTFTDSSSFVPTNWYWDFGDGYTDTVSYPVHTYTQPGDYTVTMVASNSYGSDTVIKKRHFTVIDSAFKLPWFANFENKLFPPLSWNILDNDQILSWQLDTQARGNNNSLFSVSINGGANDIWSEHDIITTSYYSLKYTTKPYISFKRSYPGFSGFQDDTLGVYAKSSCTDTFKLLYQRTNDWLKTLDSTFLGTFDTLIDLCYFVPYQENHWKIDTIFLNSFSQEENVCFQFKFTFGTEGSVLYLDDILISADKISGLPVADFTADTTTIYQNDTVHFTNLSAFSDTLQWFFTGAIISTSNDTNPSITYDSAGIFPVTLVAWNMFGRDTLTKLAYINVLQKTDTIPCDSMKIILSKNDVNCKGKNDGTVTASAFNGNSDYSFSWSTGSTLKTITGLAEGIYTVTVTDSIGCTKTAYITITEPPILSSNLAYSNVSCLGGNDGNAVVSTYGGNGSYSYSWSNGSTSIMITGLAEGIYTVTVTDSIGCTKTDSVKISYTDSLPVAGFTYSDTIVKIYFTNLSTNADSYLWQFGDNSTDTTASPLHVYSDLGIYIACLIASNNCGADTVCDTISIVDGIKENSDKIYLKIYPNPNTGSFTIIIEQPQAGEIQFTLTNILGQEIYSITTKNKIFKEELNLSNFGKGVYSLRVVTNEGSVSRKIIYR